ncbi:MAG: DUF222 domain-containing protein [Acidimicrobiia bacterium]|nr:DUF222 domain-containing protein [Acidimicrobiia bacterium]
MFDTIEVADYTTHPVGTGDLVTDDLLFPGVPDPDIEDITSLLGANQRRINQLEAQNALLVAQADEAGLPAREGFANTTAFVKAMLSIRGGKARRVVGRQWLTGMPITREAFTAGWLSVDQVDELLRAFHADMALFEEHEASLVSIALQTPLVPELAKAIDTYRGHVTPTDIVEDKAVQFEARGAYVSSTPAGMGVLTWYERPDVINRAREQLQAHAPTSSDGRTSAQLMSDTLTDLVLGGRGGGNTRMVVHVDEAVLRYHVGGEAHDRNGASLTLQEVRRLACDTQLGRHIYGSEAVTTELGRTKRVVSSRQRDLIEYRDRGCRFPACDRPSHWCDAHHIRHWLDGGLTNLDNMVLLCRFHHTLIHDQGWGLTGTPTHLTITRPAGELHGESKLAPPPMWPQMFPEPLAFRLPPESTSEYFRYRFRALGWARKGIGERPAPLDTTPQRVSNARGSP